MVKTIPFGKFLVVATVLFCCSSAALASNCEYYLNNGPINRATAFNEERISSATYSGLAQRYNGLSGQMTGIRFWARAVGSNQSMRVVLYTEAVGFPSTTIAQTTVTVPAGASWQQIDATFASPANVNGNVILSIEPTTPSTNDIWVKHNLEGNASNNYIGNGGNLYLNLVRQGVTWYKDLANGDPSWDYDFMIMPIRSLNITPGFNFNANNLSVNFTNTSTNASSYSWTFGDGGTSTSANPSHTYSASGTYQVKLVVGGPAGSGCADSITQSVVVTNTSLSEITTVFANPFFNHTSNSIEFQSMADQECRIYNVEGKLLDVFRVSKNEHVVRQLTNLSTGVYSLQSSNLIRPFRFIVQ
ncbi:MAG: PKD domain-containing protein [Bacteroidota bacterium]